MSIINRPRVSGAIAATYEVLVIFTLAITALFIGLAIFTPFEMIAGVVASIAFGFVTLVIILILASLHRTKYTLTEDKLVISVTRMIGG